MEFLTVHPYISGFVALVVVALLIPATRDRVIDTFIALVNKLTGRVTTDTQRRSAKMQRMIHQDESKFEKAKRELDDAKGAVQTVVGLAGTALRHANESDAAVAAAKAEVLRVGKHVENKVVGPEKLTQATEALTAAEAAQTTSHKVLEGQKKAADLAQKRLTDARDALKKFAGTIDSEKANAALADSLNMTNDLAGLVDKMSNTLKNTHSEDIQQEVDRALAGIPDTSDEDKMKAAEAEGNAADVLARVRAEAAGKPTT